ncbi:hypothetical protein WMY93_032741, partial [Mugilogobius chulae]
MGENYTRISVNERAQSKQLHREDEMSKNARNRRKMCAGAGRPLLLPETGVSPNIDPLRSLKRRSFRTNAHRGVIYQTRHDHASRSGAGD